MSKIRGSLLPIVLFTLIFAKTAYTDYAVTDLVDAAKRDDYHAVHNLIANEADLSTVGPMGYTALHWAGVRGNWRIFAELLAAGAPVNAVGSDGGTPLHWACHHDRADMVELLLEAGADPSVHNRWGRTPLHVAARRGCVDVAAVLLDDGADPNALTREAWTPLHVASRSGQQAAIDLLLDRGADPKLADDEGLTAAEVFRARPPEVEIDPDRLDEYVDLYDFGNGFEAKIWREGDRLRIREFAPDDLYPIGADRFACRQEPWVVRFMRTEGGEIESVELDFLRRTVRASRTDAPRFVGSTACMTCHTGAEEGHQDVLWMRGRHAHAYWNLAADWALYLAKARPHYSDLYEPIADDRCLLCHVTGAQEEDALFAATSRREEGIGCEACHGPGSHYSDIDVMTDREAFLAAGGRIPDEQTCIQCHRRSEQFDWAEFSEKIAHPKPRPEPAS